MFIIYPNGNGISVIWPAPGWDINEVAKKDVPAGVPFKIISSDDLPASREYRDAWDHDFSDNDGVGIGQEAWFELQGVNNDQAE